MMWRTIETSKSASSVLRRFLLLGCVLAGYSVGALAGSPRQFVRAAQMEFTLADFDGDHRPDLATVQFQREENSASRYSIRFQLSSGIATNISIAGPWGGLRLVAEDVNGDNFKDVTVYAIGRKEVVAVLLNNGRGEFTLADVSAFPFLATQGAGFYRGASEFRFGEEILAPPRVTPGVELQVLKESAPRDAADGPLAELGSAPKAKQNEPISGRSPPSDEPLI